ncbi:MFS transporter [Streptomyces sp. NPDC048483]|uniref:MFS transporter n=1 Tax=Streptomyces sp. NPDC048483 TaxID=3154927 RepID=UPI00343C10CF
MIALQKLNASTFEVGLLTTFSTLPWLFVSLPAGVMVDRSRKRQVMLWSDLGRFLTLCSVPVAAALGLLTLGHLYLVAFLSGTLAVFFSSAYLSFPAMLVPAEQLVDANGKVSSASATAGVLGPSLAGFLVGISGAARAVAVDGVSYLASALSLLFIRHPEPRREIQTAAQSSFFLEMLDGIRLIVSNRTMSCITFANGVGNFLLTAINSLWLVYAVRELDWTVKTVGLVMGISAVGGVVGSLLAKPLISRFGLVRVLLFGQFLVAPGQVVAGLVSKGQAGQILVTMGFTLTLASAILYDIAQRTYRIASCAPDMLGRLNAKPSGSSGACAPSPVLWAGDWGPGWGCGPRF